MENARDWLHRKAGKPSEQVCPIRIYKHPTSLDRNKLAEWFNNFGYKIGVEIGVRRAEFSEVMLKANPNLEKLFLVDPWWTEDITSRRRGEERQNKDYDICVKRMQQFGNRVQILKMTSMQAVEKIPD